jgi:hypothetical protein
MSLCSIPIAANTTYIKAYYAPTAHWAITFYGLLYMMSNEPLTAAAGSAVGENGTIQSSLMDQLFCRCGVRPERGVSELDRHPTQNPTIPSTTLLSQRPVEQRARITRSLRFGPPNYASGGVYAIESGNNLINPNRPGLGSARASIKDVTIAATQ